MIEAEGAVEDGVKPESGEVTMRTSEIAGVDESLGVQTDLQDVSTGYWQQSSAEPSVIGKPQVIKAILLHDISHVQEKGKKFLNLARWPKRELPFQNLGLNPQISERST